MFKVFKYFADGEKNRRQILSCQAFINFAVNVMSDIISVFEILTNQHNTRWLFFTLKILFLCPKCMIHNLIFCWHVSWDDIKLIIFSLIFQYLLQLSCFEGGNAVNWILALQWRTSPFLFQRYFVFITTSFQNSLGRTINSLILTFWGREKNGEMNVNMNVRVERKQASKKLMKLFINSINSFILLHKS